MKKEDITGRKVVPKEFFLGNDVVQIAKSLIGKRLITSNNGVITEGLITETEAYAGADDRASHAFGGRKTLRTAPMFEEGGIAYIYLCYGIHSLFNIVTNKEGVPDAVLIRGIMPESGIEHMLHRTRKKRGDKTLTNGPGKLAKALGLHYSFSGMPLYEEKEGFMVWVEDPERVREWEVKAGKRIGVDYAGRDAALPYRFYI